MKAYRFLTGDDDAAFCHRVTQALNLGWQLHGNPTYAFDAATGKMCCGQAVIKQVSGATYDPQMKLGDL